MRALVLILVVPSLACSSPPAVADGGDANAGQDAGDASTTVADAESGAATDAPDVVTTADVSGDADGGQVPTGVFVQATCDIGSSCTGDLNGTWHYQAMCLTEPSPTDCAGFAWHPSGGVSGTLRFDTSTNTYAKSETLVEDISATTPTSCDCNRLESFVHMVDNTTVCIGGSGQCFCGFGHEAFSNPTGTFMVSGDTLTLSGDGATRFCVSGSTLWLWTADSSGHPATVTTLTR